MPTIPYRPDQFSKRMGKYLSSPQNLEVTWGELCECAVTVGRRNWRDVVAHGTYSYLEIMWRLAMLRANLIELPDGRLKKSDSFKQLDPSEKGAISFFLGNVIAKLFAERMFGVEWLLHLDVYKKLLNPKLHGKQKPDFLGQDLSGRWLIIEAKGRSCNAPASLLETAKKQTQSVRNINGILPSCRIASATYFSADRLRVKLRDPDSFDDEAFDVDLNKKHFLDAYYQPIIDVVTSENERIEPREIPGLDASISVDQTVAEAYRSQRDDAFEPLFEPQADTSLSYFDSLRKDDESAEESTEESAEESAEESIRDPGEESVKSFEKNFESRLKPRKKSRKDRIKIELGDSWSSEFMRRQPAERGK